ncbi:MAG: hypothetical protein IPK76_12990 [Lewinellaceae bacterium]|nr:hypothetical protein [Lewinellaceae bacterium]
MHQKRCNRHCSLLKSANNTKQENQLVIKTFISECSDLLKVKNHKITDLNGFLRKAKILSQQPDASRYEIWLLINSDGKQDIDLSKKNEPLDCSQKPLNTRFYVSNWTETEDCGADGRFLNPNQFVKFIQTQIK